MFYYFPENYTWSSAFHLALMAGAQFGEMDRWLSPLKDREPNAELWGKAWSDMAQQQEDEAALDLKEDTDEVRVPAIFEPQYTVSAAKGRYSRGPKRAPAIKPPELLSQKPSS